MWRGFPRSAATAPGRWWLRDSAGRPPVFLGGAEDYFYQGHVRRRGLGGRSASAPGDRAQVSGHRVGRISSRSRGMGPASRAAERNVTSRELLGDDHLGESRINTDGTGRPDLRYQRLVGLMWTLSGIMVTRCAGSRVQSGDKSYSGCRYRLRALARMVERRDATNASTAGKGIRQC
jgi:hypothetical protein